ncbi:potassium-transporting ATPase subunit KdpC [Rhodobacter sp.]
MLNPLRPAIVMAVATTILTGLAYPLAMTGIAQGLLPEKANGSLIVLGDIVVGSSLIAQDFTGRGYLHPRPSAASYAAMPSGASNLGPTSAALRDEVAARRTAWEEANGSPAPVDALTASGSGLDPHISPENARLQAARIAEARGVPPAEVTRVIAAHTDGPWLGLYGQPRVNVLEVNLALDAALPLPPPAGN